MRSEPAVDKFGLNASYGASMLSEQQQGGLKRQLRRKTLLSLSHTHTRARMSKEWLDSAADAADIQTLARDEGWRGGRQPAAVSKHRHADPSRRARDELRIRRCQERLRPRSEFAHGVSLHASRMHTRFLWVGAHPSSEEGSGRAVWRNRRALTAAGTTATGADAERRNMAHTKVEPVLRGDTRRWGQSEARWVDGELGVSSMLRAKQRPEYRHGGSKQAVQRDEKGTGNKYSQRIAPASTGKRERERRGSEREKIGGKEGEGDGEGRKRREKRYGETNSALLARAALHGNCELAYEVTNRSPFALQSCISHCAGTASPTCPPPSFSLKCSSQEQNNPPTAPEPPVATAGRVAMLSLARACGPRLLRTVLCLLRWYHAWL
eukprot:3162563-Pleurochrysis_carterae.AAC.5